MTQKLNQKERLAEYQTFIDMGKTDEELVKEYGGYYTPKNNNCVVIYPRINKYTAAGLELVGKLLEDAQHQAYTKGVLIIAAEDETLVGKRVHLASKPSITSAPLTKDEFVNKNGYYQAGIVSAHSVVSTINVKLNDSDTIL
jgi:hypothetical protein